MNAEFTQIVGTWWWSEMEPAPMTLDRSPSVDEFQARTYSNASGVLPYRLFIPTNHDSGDKLPLVLFLHGSGARGNDNRLQLTGHSDALPFVFHENQARQRCFMAPPQCPVGGNWADSIRPAQVAGLIASLKTEFNVDTNRVYVTGLSLGGQGTWELMARYKTLFAAGVPMAGNLISATAMDLVQMPIWNFHAANDSVVNVSHSRNIVAGIRNLGGTPIYTEYAAGDHGIFSAAYATPQLFDWVMAQRRGVTSNAVPFVTINSPNDEPTYSTAGNAVSITGVAGDAAAEISQITWKNNRGGSGVAAGTNNWSIPVVNLQFGTNILTVQATGTSWILSFGGTTTFSDVIRIPRVAVPVISILRTNGFLNVTWSGGTAPLSLDSSTNLSSGLWNTMTMGTNNSASFAPDQAETYFRVRSQ